MWAPEWHFPSLGLGPGPKSHSCPTLFLFYVLLISTSSLSLPSPSLSCLSPPPSPPVVKHLNTAQLLFLPPLPPSLPARLQVENLGGIIGRSDDDGDFVVVIVSSAS